MGVQGLLPLLKPFMGTILFHSTSLPLKPIKSIPPIGTCVSRYPIDPQFDLPLTAPSVDFIGVDGSVLIHVCLRRCMTDIVMRHDFAPFVEEMRSVLSRLQHQTNKFCGITSSTRTQELFIVLDGKRLDVKLENNKRGAARKKAQTNIAQAVSSKLDGEMAEVNKQDISVAVGAFAIEAMGYVQLLCTQMGIAFAVAPAEAEHQLIYLQELGMLKFILVNDSDYIALGGSNIILDTKRSCFAFGFSVWSDRTILADTTILKRMMEGTIMCNFSDDENGLPHDRVVSVEKQASDTAAAPSTSALVPSTSAQTLLKRVRKPERKPDTPATNLLDLTPSTSVAKSTTASSKKKIIKSCTATSVPTSVPNIQKQKNCSIKWTEIIMKHGHRSIELMRCFLKSDYVSFPNVGVKRVIDAYWIIVQNKQINGINIESITTAVMFELMALAMRPFVFGEAKCASDLSKVELHDQQVISLIRKMERAHIMFNYSVVASVYNDSITHMNLFVEEEFFACVRHHTIAEMKEMVGFHDFKEINLPLWTRGHYDVSNGAPHVDVVNAQTTLVPTTPVTPVKMHTVDTAVSSVEIPTTPVTIDAPFIMDVDDSALSTVQIPPASAIMHVFDTAVSMVETTTTIPLSIEEEIIRSPTLNMSPKICSVSPSRATTEDGFPTIDSIPKMKGDILRSWLKLCGVTAPSDDCRVGALKDLLSNHILLSQHHGLLITTSIPTDEEKRTWGTKVCTAHNILKNSSWQSCLIEEPSKIPSLSQHVIDEYCEKINVSSSRVMKIAESRFSDHAKFCIDTSKQVTIDGVVYVILKIHVPTARSSTEEDRDVLITALMILSTMIIVTIKTCICLSPSGLLDQNGNVANSKLAATYKPCRSADGRCSHCVTALKFFSEGGKNYSSTRDLMYWLRKSTKARDSVKRYDKSMPVEEPFFGTHPNRANWCPFRDVYKYEILQGLSSNIYLEKMIALCDVKARELKNHGSDAVKGRDIRIRTGYDLQGRWDANLLREKKKNARLQIAASLKANYNLTHPQSTVTAAISTAAVSSTPMSNFSSDVALPRELISLVCSQSVTTDFVVPMDIISSSAAASTAAPNTALLKRSGRFQKRCNNPSGKNQFCNVAVEDTELISLKKPRIFHRACACGNPNHIGNEVDFYASRKPSVAKHWSGLLLGDDDMHLTGNERIYVHFSHFRNEDYIRASSTSDCFLSTGAEPDKTTSSVFNTKKELIQHLNHSSKIVNRRVPKKQDGSAILTECQDQQPPSSRLCICFLGACCQEILPQYGWHHVPENVRKKKKWIKILRPCSTLAEQEEILTSDARVVDRRHFSLAQLLVPHEDSDSGSGRIPRVRLRNGSLPSAKHVPISCQYNTIPNFSSTAPTPDRKTLLLDAGNLRNVFALHNIAPDASLIRDLLRVVDTTRTDAVLSTTMLLSTPSCNIVVPEVPPQCRKHLLKDIQEDPLYCQDLTGETSFKVLQSIWEWLDADKAFTTMHLDHTHHRSKTVEIINYAKLTPEELAKEKVRQSSIVEEHKHTDLSPFEQFILYTILWHRGIESGISMISKDFGITVDTARRYYNAFVCGVSFFSIHMQPNPTFLEMLATTPPQVAETINPAAAQGIHAVVVSDATEREAEAAALCAHFHFLYSVYKQRTTVKHLTVASMNGLLHTVGTQAPIDDSECVRLLGIADRLGAALRFDQQSLTGNPNYLMTFVYDKGLDSFPAFIRNMVRVVLPDKKQPQQLVFKVNSGEKDSTVARVRNLIELINCELKQQQGFNRELCLARIDMAAHEVNVARFNVNLKPEFRAKDVIAAADEPILPTRTIDQSDVHDSDSSECMCSACRMFKTIPKVFFQKPDV